MKIDRLTDRSIDYSDIPPLDDSFLTKAIEAWPPDKQQVTVRLDADILRWLKETGKGYQTRLNIILRTVMDQQARQRYLAREAMEQQAQRPRASKPRARSRRRPHAA